MLALRLEVQRAGFRLEAALECVAGPTLVLGPNGAGKTTLLRAILGALPGYSTSRSGEWVNRT